MLTWEGVPDVLRPVNTHERCKSDSEEKRHHVGPRGQCDVLLDHHNQTQTKAKQEHQYVPPPWGLPVVLSHMTMVGVVVLTLHGVLERAHNVPTPEENAMGKQGTNLELCQRSGPGHRIELFITYRRIGHKNCVGKRTRQPWQSIFLEHAFIENSFRENFRKRICSSIALMKTSRHEWLRKRIPDIAIIDAEHSHHADEEAQNLVNLQRQGIGQGSRRDLLFVHDAISQVEWSCNCFT